MGQLPVVNCRYSGPNESKSAYVKVAVQQLNALRQSMEFQGLSQGKQVKYLNDGTQIVCSSVFGVDTIKINVPREEKKEEKIEKKRSAGYVQLTIAPYNSDRTVNTTGTFEYYLMKIKTENETVSIEFVDEFQPIVADNSYLATLEATCLVPGTTHYYQDKSWPQLYPKRYYSSAFNQDMGTVWIGTHEYGIWHPVHTSYYITRMGLLREIVMTDPPTTTTQYVGYVPLYQNESETTPIGGGPANDENTYRDLFIATLIEDPSNPGTMVVKQQADYYEDAWWEVTPWWQYKRGVTHYNPITGVATEISDDLIDNTEDARDIWNEYVHQGTLINAKEVPAAQYVNPVSMDYTWDPIFGEYINGQYEPGVNIYNLYPMLGTSTYSDSGTPPVTWTRLETSINTGTPFAWDFTEYYGDKGELDWSTGTYPHFDPGLEWQTPSWITTDNQYVMLSSCAIGWAQDTMVVYGIRYRDGEFKLFYSKGNGVIDITKTFEAAFLRAYPSTSFTSENVLQLLSYNVRVSEV